MRHTTQISALDRRQFVISTTATLAAASLLPASASFAIANSRDFETIYQELVAGAQPIEDRIKLVLPKSAENGHNIKFSIAVKSPMTEQDYVEAIHILAPENPEPRVASFRLTPHSGKAEIAGRLRLAKTQDVIALAELNNGTAFIGRAKISVNISGCSG